MKNLYFTIATIMNLILGGIYCYGADHNRYICACLWAIFPIVNLILFGLFEKHIMEEGEI